MTSNENVIHALIMKTGYSRTQASIHTLGSKRDTWLSSPVPSAARVCVWPLLQLPTAAAEPCPSANWATFSQLVQHEPKRTGAAVAWHNARPCPNTVLPARTLASLCACRGILHQQPTQARTHLPKEQRHCGVLILQRCGSADTQSPIPSPSPAESNFSSQIDSVIV